MTVPHRIAFIIDALVLGGAQRSLVALANALAHRGAEVHLITFEAPAPLPPQLRLAPAIQRHALGTHPRESARLLTPLMLLRTHRALRRTIHNLAPTCVVSFLDEVNLMTLLALPRERTTLRVIVSERSFPGVSFKKRYDPLGLLPFVGRAARRYLYPRADSVITLTERGAEFLRSEGLTNVAVIPNPVPPPPPVEHRTEPEQVIVALGRLAPEKRFDRLIEAFAVVAPHFPAWRVRIYGEGPLRDVLTRHIERRQLTDRVTLCGASAAPHEVLARRPVFALTSDVEGFPVALTEAMASGCAVVATDCPTGPGELISHGEDGLLVRSRDPLVFAEALSAIMSSAALRRRLGESAQRITDRFPTDMIFDRWWVEVSAPPLKRECSIQ
jgi:glycosyltransferase involved in cell wall biosynthesis